MAGTITDTGCWIDGWWGQYGVARSVQIAHEFGYGDYKPDEATIVDIAIRHLATMGYSDRPGPFVRPLDDDECAALDDAADDIVEWLNERAAADGYSFGWHEGDLLLLTDDEWETLWG